MEKLTSRVEAVFHVVSEREPHEPRAAPVPGGDDAARREAPIGGCSLAAAAADVPGDVVDADAPAARSAVWRR